MALSGAERARRYRVKKEVAGLSQSMKKKDRIRKRLARSKMTSTQLVELRLRQRANLQKCRSKQKNLTRLPAPTSPFKTKQTKGKALRNIINVLPANKEKQIELISQMAENLGILNLKKKHERVENRIPM